MLYAHQYGFKTGHCSECAALEIIDRVTTQVDIKYRDIPLNILSLELSTAFDSLDHVIMYSLDHVILNKLKYYGVLTDRNQFVQIDNRKSSILHLKTGVPYGSIIGPPYQVHYPT